MKGIFLKKYLYCSKLDLKILISKLFNRRLLHFNQNMKQHAKSLLRNEIDDVAVQRTYFHVNSKLLLLKRTKQISTDNTDGACSIFLC